MRDDEDLTFECRRCGTVVACPVRDGMMETGPLDGWAFPERLCPVCAGQQSPDPEAGTLMRCRGGPLHGEVRRIFGDGVGLHVQLSGVGGRKFEYRDLGGGTLGFERELTT